MNKSNRRNNTSKTNGGVGRTSLTDPALLSFQSNCSARSPDPDTQQGCAGVECDAKRKKTLQRKNLLPPRKKHFTVCVKIVCTKSDFMQQLEGRMSTKRVWLLVLLFIVAVLLPIPVSCNSQQMISR